MKRVDVVIGIVVRDGKILICQRRQSDALAGYWEFPGGKLEPGETLEQCLARELREELAIIARPIEPLAVIEHDYPHVQVRLHPYLCQHESGDPQPLAAEQAIWVAPTNLARYRFPSANDDLIRQLIARFSAEIQPQSATEDTESTEEKKG